MKKTIRKVLSGLMILIFFITLNFFNRNILDDMYLDAKMDGGILINNVKEAEQIDYIRWTFLVSSGFFNTEYKEEYLREEYEKIWVAYYGEEPNIYLVGSTITLSKTLSNTISVFVNAEYDYDTKILTWLPLEIRIHKEEGEPEYEILEKAEDVLSYLEEEGVTKADVKEYQHYVLEEIVLKTWAKGNLRFPFHLLRGVRVIDRAWDIPE